MSFGDARRRGYLGPSEKEVGKVDTRNLSPAACLTWRGVSGALDSFITSRSQHRYFTTG